MAETNVEIGRMTETSALEKMSVEDFEMLELSILEEHQGGVGPRVVDFEITGACPWRCEWCWGPEHTKTGSMSPLDWQRTTDLFATMGTERVTITGGEPLLDKNLEGLIDRIQRDKMNVTLSTSGSELENRTSILEKLNEGNESVIGMPLDGATPESNARMRPALNPENSQKNFRLVLDNLALLQEHYPNIGITLRTVISSLNYEEIIEIPDALEAHGIDLTRIRWKLYQLNPNEGPRTESMGEYEIDGVMFKESTDGIISRWGSEFAFIDLQPVEGSSDRYVFVDPDGNVRLPDEVETKVNSWMEMERSRMNIRTNPATVAEIIPFIMNGLELPKLLVTHSDHMALDMLRFLIDEGELNGEDFQNTTLR